MVYNGLVILERQILQDQRIIGPYADPGFTYDSKPQKFFKRQLDNDLEYAAERLKVEYDRIANREMVGIGPIDDNFDIFTYAKSISTQKSREYNVFQMYYPFIHELYSAVVSMTKEACEYYEIDYNSEQWMAAGWFNINSREKGGKLEWHDHIDTTRMAVPAFHGYYAVNAEPSQTHYKVGNETKINENKNNEAIMSMMGFQHAQGPWDWEGERITIAYDVVPLRIGRQEAYIESGFTGRQKFWEQHYVPLPREI